MCKISAIILIFFSFTACAPIIRDKSTASKESFYKNALTQNGNNVVHVFSYNTKNKPYYFGTGFICHKKGLICTARHVVAHNATTKTFVRIRQGNRNFIKKVIWIKTAQRHDLAILKVNHKFKTSVKIRLTPLKPDEFLYTLGYPHFTSTNKSLNKGLILSRGRFVKYRSEKFLEMGFDSVVQLSRIPVLGGNSGGPVFDINGRVVGVVVFINKFGRVSYSFTSSIQMKYCVGLLAKISLLHNIKL